MTNYTTQIWRKFPKNTIGALASEHWGIYLFGGLKEGVGQTNDLFFIKPKMRDYKKNEKLEVKIEVIELHPDGRPPVPRMLHSAVFFNERYLSKLG